MNSRTKSMSKISENLHDDYNYEDVDKRYSKFKT